MRYLLVLACVVACARHPDAELGSPASTAHAFAAAVQRKDAPALEAMSAARLRPLVRAEIARDPERFWLRMQDDAAEVARLAKVTEADFAIEATSGDDRLLGDKLARFPLRGDHFDVARAPDGKWYLVDTGF